MRAMISFVCRALWPRRAIACLLITTGCVLPAANRSAGSTPSRAAAAPPCRSPDAVTARHLHYLRMTSIGTAPADSAWRAGTRVPVVADTLHDIVVVTDSSLCASGLAAYNALITPDSLVSEIELLQADTVFVADHPSIRSGEFVASHVFDRAFRFLGGYLQ